MGPEYAPLWLQWRQEAATIRFNPLDPIGQAELERRLAANAHDLRDVSRTDFRWVVLRGTEAIGTVGLKEVSWRMGTGVAGWCLGEQWHGQGLGTQAVALYCEEVFATSALRRIVGYIHPDNVASRRLAVRLGFVEEGVLRQHVMLNGTPVDQVVAGLLRDDWLGGAARQALIRS